MKYNIKVISDIHFGEKNDKTLWNELNEEFFPTIDENLDLLVIAGDLFHRIIKVNEPTCSYVINFIDLLDKLAEKLNFKIRIIKGTKSHDFNQLNIFQNYEINDRFGIATEVCEEEVLPGLNVLYIPEEYMEDQNEYYKNYFNKKYDMIFFHGTMDFAGFTNHLSENKDTKQAPTFKSNEMTELAYGPIIGGHIHIRQSYKNKIFYTGSFSRFKFGEPENKGFIDCSYDTDSKEYEVNYINNEKAPEYVTVKLSDVTGTLEEKIKKIELLKENYENIRIDVKESDKKGNETIIEAIKNLTNDNVKLNVSNSFEESYDSRFDFILKKELSFEASIKKFINITTGKDIELNEIKKIINENNN